MKLQQVRTLAMESCPRSPHKGGHKILSIPGRDDVCLVFCAGWGNRLFLIWERAGKLYHRWIGGADNYQVIVNRDTLTIKGNVLDVYCSALNFMGASPGARLVYDLGEHGVANPVAVKSSPS